MYNVYDLETYFSVGVKVQNDHFKFNKSGKIWSLIATMTYKCQKMTLKNQKKS